MRPTRASSFRRLTAAGRSGLFVLALSGLMVYPASAGRRKPPTKTPEYKQTYDVIESVNPGAQTITVATMQREVAASHPNQGVNTKAPKGDGSHAVATVTLKVDNFADIELNDQKSNFGALKKGMKVDVTKGSDGTTVDRLVVIR